MERSGISDRIEEWMAECLLLEGEERERAIEDLCARHPAEADEIRGRFRVLADLDLDEEPAEPFPERLGDFRLVERLGGGGMGVVYRAEQESLGREVALKVIRPELLYFPGSRERFQREVHAVASLQHPGIVPVYAVGEEAGVPHFAMELVRGATLQEVLERLDGRAPESLQGGELEAVLARLCAERGMGLAEDEHVVPFGATWQEACLNIAVQVADALEHAHRRGVVHRDVKPSNVALSVDGRALLLDFGLTSSAETERLTRSGSQVGTLYYMSSEQVRSRRTDGRSDVYSLGVTLFELLTLQVPFRGESPLDTHRMILEGIDAQSHPVRARNRRVSKECETVCLKAMDADPGCRYATAAAFRADMENVLARRPIVARPPRPIRRVVRWSQRNTTPAVTLGLGALMAVGLPTSLFLQEAQYNEELTSALDRAETEATMSAEVSDFLVDLFRAPDLVESMGRDVLAREILDQGVADVRSGALRGQPEVRARLMAKMGEIYSRLSLFKEAEELLLDAEDYWTARLCGTLGAGHVACSEGAFDFDALSGEEAALLDAEGGVHVFADVEHELARTAKAFGRLDEAQRRLLTVASMKGGYSPGSRSLAVVWHDLGQVALDRHDDDAAASYLERALDIYRAEAARDPDGETAQLELANVLATFGACLLRLHELDDAREVLDRALELQQRWLPPGHYSLGATRMHLGAHARRSGRAEEAVEHYRAAVEITRNVVKGRHESYARALQSLADATAETRRFDEAVALFREAREVFLEVTDRSNTAAVLCTSKLAQLLAQLGRCDEAHELFEEVIPLQERAFAPEYPLTWVTRSWHARCIFRDGHEEEARDYMRSTMERMVEAVGEDAPLVAAIRREFAELLR